MSVHQRALDIERVQTLLVGSDDLQELLDGLAVLAAEVAGREAGVPVECAVSLHRRKRPSVHSGTTPMALQLIESEHGADTGPLIEASMFGSRVWLDDATIEEHWPLYGKTLALAGYASALIVPLEVGERAHAVLVFLSGTPNTFTQATTAETTFLTDAVSQALRIAVKIATGTELLDDLKAAMKSRTVIDLACGMIMLEDHCSQEEAFETLKKASCGRNQKLSVIAEDIVRRTGHTSGPPTAT
ncbi:GAF and ANTAR domain-containing protein [Paenarthrobacter sp. NCHU4564]|uniref:GAF and ANTAR domain-containing protein n=1 Tax=Paenarthrobacter sp. NCHU4564 TaxID=3451353 RepID=UPI003F95C245